MSAKDLNAEFARKTVKFRGRTYDLQELPISEYDDITTKATVKIDVDGQTVERLNSALQARLMLEKAITKATPPLPAGGVRALGTRLNVALNQIVGELHFGAEKDELADESAKATETVDDEESPKGND